MAGSTWDVLRRAAAGPLRGTRLEQAVHLDTSWFAWVGFRPETTLIEKALTGLSSRS